MQDILKEYGPAILTVIAILALIVLVKALIGSDARSIVGGAFTSLINSFFNTASQGMVK